MESLCYTELKEPSQYIKQCPFCKVNNERFCLSMINSVT